jgi:hypothetical protein
LDQFFQVKKASIKVQTYHRSLYIMSQSREASSSSASALASVSASSAGGLEDIQSDMEGEGIQLLWAEDSFLAIDDLLLSNHEIEHAIKKNQLSRTVVDYYYRSSLPTFPSSLIMNRSTEEPPYPSCSQRGLTWRRVYLAYLRLVARIIS